MKLKLSQIVSITAIIFGVFIFVLFLSKQDIFQRASYALNDILTHRFFYADNNHSDSVVIIKIDDKTLDVLWRSDLGILSFDKWVYGEVLEKLFSQYDVAGVWFDIVFANPSVLWFEDELALRDALEKYKDQVVIATFASWDIVPLCLYSSSIHWFADAQDQEIVRYFQSLHPSYPLTDICWNHDIHPENLWSIRGLASQLLQVSIPHLSPLKREELESNLELFLESNKNVQYISYFANGINNDGTIWFRSYSLIDILEWKQIDLAGKMVLIWEVWTAIHDSHFTPISPNVRMPWVEIQANIIETIYQWVMLKDMHPWVFYILKLLFLCLVLIWVFLLRLSYSIIWLWVLCATILLIAVGLFTVSWIFLQTLHLLSFVILSYILLYLYRFTVTDKLKRELKKQFSLYVSPDVVNDITQNPESVILKGEKRDITIFFSDIENFTSLSERVNSQDLVILLNEYFHEMTHIIHKNKGTLDKYIGDAVMCFFWAPTTIKNHTYFACKTAIEQQSQLTLLRKKWASEWKEAIKIRIWIHAWDAIHWNIWSSDTRVDYTIMWDNVNIASRLEGICKEYGISICVSQEVYLREKENFYFRELDEIKLKWKKEAIKIYELLDFKEKDIAPWDMEKYWVYRKGLDLYRLWQIKEAYTVWSKNTEDMPSLSMAERCKQISLWHATVTNGIYTMLHK